MTASTDCWCRIYSDVISITFHAMEFPCFCSLISLFLFFNILVLVKGIEPERGWPSTTELVASAGNGVGVFPGAPNGEGDKIKRKREIRE